MPNSKPLLVCKYCEENGSGNFCQNCGQAYQTKRLTISSIVHEIFHFFSHLDKGFLYTLKSLIVSPGKTQREYVDGHRVKHQKPFAMFFLCATLAMLVYYWVNMGLLNYFSVGNADEAAFFHQYAVILHIVMLPVYAFFTYGFFSSARYNYAETLVLLLYNLSLILLVSSLLQPLKFIWPDLETRFIELPIIVFYNIVTNLKFYEGEPKWLIFLKTILSTALCFFVSSIVQDYLIKNYL
jgi:hypothetical protein